MNQAIDEQNYTTKKWYKSFPLIILILLNIIPSAFLSNLAFDNAAEVYLPSTAPSVILEKKLRQLFPEDQMAFVLFQGEGLYEDAFLNNLEKVSRLIKRSDLVDRVINVTEMEHISATEDGFEVSHLLGKDTRKNLKTADERFNLAKSDHSAMGMVVSKDKNFMAMVVRPVDLESTLQRLKMMEDVDKLLIEHDLKKYVVATAGPVPVEIEQFKSMIRDTLTFVPATMIISWFWIWILYRRLLAVVVAGLVTGAVVNSTLLFFVMFSLPYTLISGMLPPLLAALTTAFLIHFYSYMQLASGFGYKATQCVDYALSHIKKPSLFTALTTALGFVTLALSPIPPITHFGLIAGVGMVFLFTYVIYVMPSIFKQLDHVAWPQAKKGSSVINSFLKRMLNLSLRHSVKVIVVTLILFSFGVPYIFQVVAETNMLKFFPQDHKVTTSSELIEEKLTGIMSLEVELYSKQRDGFKKSNNLKQLEKIQTWLEEQDEIDKATSLANMIKDMHSSFNQGDEKFKFIPDNDPLISQYFFIYDGNEVYEIVNREFNQARIILSVNEHSSKKVGQLITKMSEYLEKNKGSLTWQIAGDGKLFSDQDKLLVEGQVKSLFAAVILIFIIMLALWKKLSYSLLTMIPNLSPIIGIFILMGIFGIWLDMATAMIAGVAIGIAVDDTIHLFHSYKKRIDKGCSVVYSIVQSYYKTGRAIVVTTIILCSQFFLLFFSQFVPTSNFGLLTATGLLMALIFDLFLLPAVIVLLYHRKKI